mmetsp:Transcript_41893/g.118782  ORF Transcript_41893/g.118782 Transcript_41893/m.118782 type:complete len:168 (+) Transcript_41893:1146-1649(+)
MAARSSAQKWIPGWMDGIHFLSRIESVCRPLACEQAGRRDGHQSIQEVLTRFFINLTCYGEGGERAGGDSCGDFMCVCVCVCRERRREGRVACPSVRLSVVGCRHGMVDSLVDFYRAPAGWPACVCVLSGSWRMDAAREACSKIRRSWSRGQRTHINSRIFVCSWRH